MVAPLILTTIYRNEAFVLDMTTEVMFQIKLSLATNWHRYELSWAGVGGRIKQKYGLGSAIF